MTINFKQKQMFSLMTHCYQIFLKLELEHITYTHTQRLHSQLRQSLKLILFN